MIFHSKNGKAWLYKYESQKVTRTVQFHPHDPAHWEERDLLDVIWDVAGNLVTEVRLQSVYHHPDSDKVTRVYDLTFLTGKNILYGRMAVNKLLVQIEEAIVDRLPVDSTVRRTTVAKVIPNITAHPRTRMKRLTSFRTA